MEAPDRGYAFISKWSSMDDARFLAALLKNNIKVRFTERVMTLNGKSFDIGSLIITRRDNKRVNNFEQKISELATLHERNLEVVSTGFMDNGPDIGSSDVRYLEKPKVALLGYEGTSSLAFGATWHFLEQELGYPVTVLGTDYFNRVDLDEYDVLIMPNGWYGNFGEREMKSIADWVSGGGKLIAVQGALNKLKNSEYSSLKSFTDDAEQSIAEEDEKSRAEQRRFVRYEDRERDYMKDNTPGAIYKVKVDNSHPLAFGYPETYYTLKTSSSRVAYLEDNNVGVIASENDLMSGFAGQYAQEDVIKSLVFGTEQKGRGQIVYFVDDPLYRMFWQNGKLLVVNALFFVGQ